MTRVAVAALLLLIVPKQVAGQPDSRADALRLYPDNPHYFLFRGKPAVLITAGEHYGAVLNLDFDYVRYLDELKACGFNLTRTFSGTYPEVGGAGDQVAGGAVSRSVGGPSRRIFQGG